MVDKRIDEIFGFTEEDLNDDMPAIVEDAKDKILKLCSRLFADLSVAFRQMGPQFSVAAESNESLKESIDSLFEIDDPRSNGWVGDDGLP